MSEENGNEEENTVRLELVSEETGEPLLDTDGSPMILDEEISKLLIDDAERQGVSVDEVLAQAIYAAQSLEEQEVLDEEQKGQKSD